MSQQQEVLCPACRGGNSPQAIHCQWCGTGLGTQPKPDKSVRNVWVMVVVGGIVGILTLLGACVVFFTVLGLLSSSSN
jgi:uncharacterized protein (DUF983 family)